MNAVKTISRPMMWMLMICLLPLTAARADNASPAYRELMASKDFAGAAQQLKSLIKDRNTPAENKWRLTADLAKALRYQGKAGQAVRVLSKLSPVDASKSAARAELGWSLMLANRRDDAVPVLETLRGDSDIEARFTATCLLAYIALQQKRYQHCMDLCEEAVRISRKIDFYHNPYEWELREIQAEMLRVREAAKDQAIAERYGEDYANYRRGRLLQSARQYEKAIGYYRKIKAPVLRDAAACYIGTCLVELGYIEQAVTHWKAFSQAEEMGLYRGEVLYEWGKHQLLNSTQRDHLQAAEARLNAALKWCERAKQTTPAVTVASIQEVLKAFPMPKNAASRDRFGNFHRAYVSPETITNRLTATWYLTDLEMKARLLHTFVLYELGDKRASASAEQLIKLNQRSGGGLLKMGDMPRQLVSDGKDGAFLIPQGAWNSLSREYALSLHLASYLLIAGDLSWANRLFENVYRQVNGRADAILEWSVAEYGLAAAAVSRDDLPGAISRLGRFETSLRDSPLAPLGVLLAAHCYAGQTEGWEDAAQRYVWVARNTAGTNLAPRAMLSLAIAATNVGEDKVAAEACEGILSQYEKSQYASAAATLLARVKGVSLRKRRSKNGPAMGRVIPYDRHLVIPGHVDFTVHTERLKAGDLLEYQIGYSVRSGCRIGRFWYSLTLHEPQPQPTSTSPLRFLRAPVLAVAD